jgi:ABC-type dipeptide/oligopeptide/nickel transport system ATPase subunit
LSFGPSLLGEVDKTQILECLKDVDLSEEFVKRDASKLSGGEKRRVTLARALALRPKVLLLDEPTTGADPKNVEKIENTIINFSKNRKLTVLWVTHYVEQAKRVSDRIANLKNGFIRETKDTVDFKWEEAY